MAWSANDVPDQTGRVAVVTGANTGLGFETAKVLAGHGARVVVACRDMDKGRNAVTRILAAHPHARVELSILDVADQASVREFARRLAAEMPALDLLINNAGIMAVPRAVTADGFELQLATNHLGHFALTGRLFPLLRRAAAPRVVTVSSAMHKRGRINFDDLQCERRYNRWLAYARTKLANLLFSRELQRRVTGLHDSLLSVACHPGYVSTQLQHNAQDAAFLPMAWGMAAARTIFSQDAASGALPTLYCATAPNVEPMAYVGPGGPFRLAGPPAPDQPSRRARDEAVAARLWEVSEDLTGVTFP